MTRCTTTIRTAATTLAAMALLAACSGSSATTDLSLVDPATTTTTAPPTTLELTTTTAATTTTSTTSLPTTSPPTTTTEPEDVEAQIRADFARTVELRGNCNVEPAMCDFSGVATPGSRFDVSLREVMEFRIANNLRSVPGFGRFEYVIEMVSLQDDSAVVTVCAVDSVVLFDVRDPNDPNDDVVFDDSAISSRTDWLVERTDRGWVRSSGETTAQTTGADLCDVA